MSKVTLSHGSGGQASSDLIKKLFINNFNNPILNKMDDSSIIVVNGTKIAFTTDSYVINPIFFPGGDIGKLAVCGTVNDLSMVGAKPIALSCGFIIEEGLDIEVLEKVSNSMRQTAKEAGVEIITGDTKVVNKGCADKLFINTSGIGIIDNDIKISSCNAEVGDKVIISGNIGDHGASIIIAREEFGIEGDIISDVSPLNELVSSIVNIGGVKVLRDPTRGGVATSLNEIAEASKVEIEINEEHLPIDQRVNGVCNILGLDPLYLANEGKMIIVVNSDKCDEVLSAMKSHKYGKNARIIGEVKKKYESSRVYLITKNGGSRIINKLIGDNLPRIC